jgi:dUTP pyrophosphatase
MFLKVKFLSEEAKNVYDEGKLLKYQTVGSSGIDIRALGIMDPETGEKFYFSKEKPSFTLKPNSRVLIMSGFAVEFDNTFELQIRSRSGLALKNGIIVLNSPGTIDSDYRGEIGAILINTSTKAFEINVGERIAQGVFMAVVKAELQIVDFLLETERGAGGFGSTGLK